MAVIHARVDEKLIHSQVAMVWTNTVGATHIIVVNDEVVKDKMIVAGLKMAKLAGVKLSILFKERAVGKFIEKTYGDDKVFLVTKNIGDMVGLVEVGLPVPAVSVGDIVKRKGSRPIKKSVSLAGQDIADIKGLIKSSISVTVQMISNESDQITLNYL